ncbi:MAG: hypothetical protein IPM29_01855 [Planctomycetes bacterium]|nr:hypothetical protein [Planctomycetota bacterium]
MNTSTSDPVRRARAALACLGVAVTLGASLSPAQVPARLPDPDGRPGDATKPVQVYILAGQSNMVGMGDVGGARSHYAGVFLSPDPAAPLGTLAIHTVGSYRIRPLDVFVSDEPHASRGAVASLYEGAYDPATDYDVLRPVRTEPVALGVVRGVLPSLDRPHTVVVRGCVEVPESGRYSIHPGYGESARNVTELDGEVVYRNDSGSDCVLAVVELETGVRHRFTITYCAGGSTALWMSQEELVGHGDLETVVRREGKFPNLIDDDGNWTVRHDVWLQEARLVEGGRGSWLSATSNGRSIGPELGFGHVLGTFHDAPVLLIKTAQGNRSLGFDFRPPSSGRNDPANKWESLEYQLMIQGVRDTLDRIGEIVPGYQGQGYELAGFVWWQGHKDSGSPELVAEYEQNLVHLIRDVRAEFGVPDLPVAVATVGFDGHAMSGAFLQILQAQLAVGDPERHPELAGTVASVDTRDFWREIDESPANQGYHYNRNAETYLLVGDALGRAMVRLRGGEAEPLPRSDRPRAITPEPVPAPSVQDEAAAQRALAPILLDGVARAYVADARNRDRLLREARSERPERFSQFLRGAMYGLTSIYGAAGIDDFDWHGFGPDLRELEWDYFSFDPPEVLPRERGDRYRKVTWPDGMTEWFAPGFDAAGAGWRRGLPPFGQLDGELAPLSTSCSAPFCGCSQPPRALWSHEVLMLRGTFEFPALKADHRYRLVVGGSAHVNAGEGFAIYVNGRLLAESTSGVGRRQGGQPRGAMIDEGFRDEFRGGPVTIAVCSFLRYNNPGGPIPPRGHISVWMEEAHTPPLGDAAAGGR